MRFASRLTRCPIPYEPARAADVPARLAGLAPELRALLEGAAGCSPFLSGLMQKEGDWLEAALEGTPEAALDAELGRLAAAGGAEALASELRRAKRRVALLAGLADLGGVWPLEAVTGMTRAGARALGLADRGVLRAGTRADVAIYAIDEPAELAWRLGGNPCLGTIRGGVPGFAER